jgi:hypothetical protein
MATLTRSVSHLLASLDTLGHHDLARVLGDFRAQLAEIGWGCDMTVPLKEDELSVRILLRRADPESDLDPPAGSGPPPVGSGSQPGLPVDGDPDGGDAWRRRPLLGSGPAVGDETEDGEVPWSWSPRSSPRY